MVRKCPGHDLALADTKSGMQPLSQVALEHNCCGASCSRVFASSFVEFWHDYKKNLWIHPTLGTDGDAVPRMSHLSPGTAT